MSPWAPPEKKANMVRFIGLWPIFGGPNFPTGKYTSGMETSLLGWNPSEVLALHKTLVKFLKRFGFAFEISGA
jgi:hypothetical protein